MSAAMMGFALGTMFGGIMTALLIAVLGTDR